MTLGQMRLFIREGAKLKNKDQARLARAVRAAHHADQDDFERYLEALRD